MQLSVPFRENKKIYYRIDIFLGTFCNDPFYTRTELLNETVVSCVLVL